MSTGNKIAAGERTWWTNRRKCLRFACSLGWLRQGFTEVIVGVNPKPRAGSKAPMAFNHASVFRASPG